MAIADAHLLSDVRLDLQRAQLRPVFAAGAERRAVAVAGRTRAEVDLALTGGRDNLAQAVMMRLLTPRGELAELGHADYGSRLHELVGAANTATRRSLAKLHILESLAQEPRVAKVIKADVTPAVGQRDRVDVLLEVLPAGATETVTIGPFGLSFAS
jgi:phage baseplate assembly protein W